MKRKRKGKGSEEDAEKHRWKWEWVRRSKEYRKDFDRYKRALQKPGSTVKLEMYVKWGMTELPDPYDTSQETPRIDLNMPSLLARFSDDLLSLLGIEITPSYDRILASKQKKNAGWKIFPIHGKVDLLNPIATLPVPLTSENCPHYLAIVARVDPWIQKTRLMKAINQCAKENLDKLLEAQRSVFPKKPLRPRLYEFSTYANVYDLREKGKSWRAIAKQILPDVKKTEVAMRRVRYYYDQAKWWIDEGWRVL
jgi:hypothetical protein